MKHTSIASRRHWLTQAVCLAALALASSVAVSQNTPQNASPTKAKSDQSHLKWADLVPPGWDPAAEVRKHLKTSNFDIVSDNDPRMLKMLKEMREVWDNAPTNPAMDGARGRIPGYLVPLEENKQGIKEMLLVPYYGACIHSPPPPANQIIHVVLAKPAKGFASMDTVWVMGTLKAFRGDSYMGASGYKMEGAQLEPYVKGQTQPSP